MVDVPGNGGASLLIKRARESLGFSLREWAQLISVSPSQLSRFERGIQSVPDYVVKASERKAGEIAMKRRTLLNALAAVPALAAEPIEKDPAWAEKTLQYGLWLGNRGDFKEAHRMYGVATTMADWVGHAPTMGYVRARSAQRGIYEGWQKAAAMGQIKEAMAISKHARVVVEANAALVQIHVLAGDYASARSASDTMLRASDTDDDHVRTAVFRNYIECMIGNPAMASQFYDRNETALNANPVWGHEARVYQGLAAVRAGDRSGVRTALNAVKGLGEQVHMIGVGVSHVLDAVDFESSEVEELQSFAKV